MSSTHNYQLYSKDNGRRIVREHRIIQENDLSQYTHHEKMLGWPEKIVYWRIMGDGSAVGISPDSEAAAKEVAKLNTEEFK